VKPGLDPGAVGDGAIFIVGPILALIVGTVAAIVTAKKTGAA
jgi:hypothetical protein